MIKGRMHILDLMNMRLAESIENRDICENMHKFNRFCCSSRIDIMSEYKMLISEVYAVNVALECLRDVVENGIWPKEINYDLISSINDTGVRRYHGCIVLEKGRLIEIACEEIEMVRKSIETNMHKYENII